MGRMRAPKADVAALGAAPAFADESGDVANKLANVSYDENSKLCLVKAAIVAVYSCRCGALWQFY